MRPEIFSDSVTNWLEIPTLMPMDKQLLMNSYLGFNAPSDFHSRLHAAPDSRFPEFLQLFSTGLNRFCNELDEVEIPRSFSDLGYFLVEKASEQYGTIVKSAVAMLLDGPVDLEDWTGSLKFDRSGNEMKIRFDLFHIVCALRDWLVQVDENGQVMVNPKFWASLTRRFSTSTRSDARWQLIGYFSNVLKSEKMKGRKSELNAVLNLPALYVRNNERQIAEKLLSDLNFLEKTVRLGALSTLIDRVIKNVIYY